MTSPSAKVAIVVDPLCSKQEILWLLARMHVWLVSTPPNEAVAEDLWSHSRSTGCTSFLMSQGLTTFQSKDPADRIESCLGVLEDVCEHHFGYGDATPNQRILIVGTECSASLTRSLEQIGFQRESDAGLTSHFGDNVASVWVRTM